VGSGGAIAMGGGDDELTVSGCNFVGGDAYYGSALYIPTDNKVTVEGSVFAANEWPPVEAACAASLAITRSSFLVSGPGGAPRAH
jgi:hypothetical protein